ncbi:MAG: hypothetical protein ACOY4O_04520 [Pseudomonadota bacterium]
MTHFIDKVAKLSHDCTRLADRCEDRRLAAEIAALARKLLEAASDEAALEPVTAVPLPEPTMFPDAS